MRCYLIGYMVNLMFRSQTIARFEYHTLVTLAPNLSSFIFVLDTDFAKGVLLFLSLVPAFYIGLTDWDNVTLCGWAIRFWFCDVFLKTSTIKIMRARLVCMLLIYRKIVLFRRQHYIPMKRRKLFLLGTIRVAIKNPSQAW